MGARIKHHPILGESAEGRKVTITVDGRPVQACEGEPIAVALMAAGKRVLRYTEKFGEPRGVFCALGRCTDCAMTVDGRPNVRTCVTPVHEGMQVETQHGLGERRGYDEVTGNRNGDGGVGRVRGASAPMRWRTVKGRIQESE